MPRVSIVIPCYNRAAFLGEAIDSAIGQIGADIDVIVVDDGSTDDSRAVAARYAGVDYLYQPNAGPSMARNNGCDRATTDFVIFLDADDRLTPTAAAEGVARLMPDDCAMASGQVRLIDEHGRRLEETPVWCPDGDPYRAFLQGNYVWTPSAVTFRRRAVQHVGGFAPGLCGVEDWDLYLRLARQSPVACHPHTVAEYRMHPGQLSQRSARMLRDSVRALQGQRAALRSPADAAALRRGLRDAKRFYGVPLAHELRRAVANRQWREAATSTLALLRHYPRGLLRAAPAPSDSGSVAGR
jgi:glycosyltransferase involved in cell wall biosynthesis